MPLALPRPDRRALFTAAQLFAAAFGALCIAVALGLHNPFWAAMPVWVVHQTWRQDLALRGVLRILGTLAGAGVGLGALLLFPPQTAGPAWAAAALGLTVMIASAAARRIGTIYSYGPQMAAITCGVVVAPALALGGAPDGAAGGAIGAVGGAETLLSHAADRVWCTLIGVGAVTLCTFPFTPKRAEPRPPRHPAPLWTAALPRGAFAGACAGASAWIAAATGGFGAMSAALSIAVFGSLLAGMSNPAPVLRYLVRGAAIGVGAAALYRGIGAALDPAPALQLALAGVFIAAGALMRATPATAPLGLDANMCFLLAAEIGAAGRPFVLTLEGGAALLVCSAAMTGAWKLLFKPVPPPAA